MGTEDVTNGYWISSQVLRMKLTGTPHPHGTEEMIYRY